MFLVPHTLIVQVPSWRLASQQPFNASGFRKFTVES
jgi:hypothetical protein